MVYNLHLAQRVVGIQASLDRVRYKAKTLGDMKTIIAREEAVRDGRHPSRHLHT
jgi:hypothetical protein